MLNPCIWSSYFIKLPIEEAIGEFLNCGFLLAELSDEHAQGLLARGNPEKTGNALKAYADGLGFRFPQGHLKLRGNLCAGGPEDIIGELKNWLDLFHAVGIRSAVLHAGHMENASAQELLQKRVERLSQLTDHIKDTSMTICLENLRDHTIASCESILEVIQAVGGGNLGICLDTGHLNLSKANGQQEFITKAGSYLKALHIADNEGETDQHLMPYGRGNVDWTGVLRGLGEIEYPHAFNFEIPGETQRVPMEILRKKLAYVRGMADSMSGEMNHFI